MKVRLAIALLVACGCGSEDPAARSSLATPAAAMERGPGHDAPAIFSEVAAASGLDFEHFNGMSGKLYFAEMTGPGVALFDYDNDGDLDVYAVQGGLLGGDLLDEEREAPPDLRDRLFRNDLSVLPDGSRRASFTDVTAASGLDARGYGMGVATGDYDNDGWVDLYVTNFGANQLWRNRRDGTFEDVTRETGTGSRDWSVPAVFFDLDRDGWLDLFVANYVDYSIATHKPCRQPSGAPEYCGPLSYEPVADRLFRNRGDGVGGRVTFEDVTAAAGLRSAKGGALGVTVADFDRDGWLDLYVANDGVPNLMWMNRTAAGAPFFSDSAFVAGNAVNGTGQAEASMGVRAGDYDRDGDEDLFMTHLTRETNTLYRNDGAGQFDDVSKRSGIGPSSWESTGFGTGWLDFDNDGWLDLLAVNGAVKTIPEQVAGGDPHPLRQPNQLYRNLGDENGGVRLEEVTAHAGPAFGLEEVSRGAAFGDVDNDGDVDVVVANNAGPLRLLINEVGQDRPWIGFRLTGRLLPDSEPRDMLGAWVGAVRGDGAEIWRRVGTGGSYASASDPRILVGLGKQREIDRVIVHWPDGAVETFAGSRLAVGRYHTLRRGEGVG